MNHIVKKEDQISGSENVLNVVINSLRAIFPAWRSSIKSQRELDELKKEWLIAFIENNIKTDIQINRGLKRARAETSPFMPSVGMFMSWCKPPIQSHVEFNTRSLENDRKVLSGSALKEFLITKGYKS